VITKAKKNHALLQCLDFFRDQIFFGSCTPRQEEKYQELLHLCAEALGDPSLADAGRIAAHYAHEQNLQARLAHR
jgi:hypothetical protein